MGKSPLVQRVERRLAELSLGPVEATQGVDGLERNYIRDLLENKKRSFSQAKAPLVAQALHWTVHDLMGDAAPPSGRRDRLIRVPLLDTVTAGKLAVPMSQIPVEDVPLLAFADLGRGEFFALMVEGSSMDRLSPEGSVIVVNRADKTLVNGKCYVFNHRGETTFKRWQGGEPAYLEPWSTDPRHTPIFIKKKRDLEVVGRVKRTVLDL